MKNSLENGKIAKILKLIFQKGLNDNSSSLALKLILSFLSHLDFISSGIEISKTKLPI